MRRAFPDLRRSDLSELHRRFRRVQQRRRQRKQSRLKWLAPGTVWAADFKERREPIEGRFGWILSIKDLASRYQLASQPLEAATAVAVQAVYRRLFDEHGPPLVLKSDNGSQFRDEGTKATLAQYRVAPLYNPVRHPSYNGGVGAATATTGMTAQATVGAPSATALAEQAVATGAPVVIEGVAYTGAAGANGTALVPAGMTTAQMGSAAWGTGVAGAQASWMQPTLP